MQSVLHSKKKYIRKLLNVELILLTLEKKNIYIYSHFIFFWKELIAIYTSYNRENNR